MNFWTLIRFRNLSIKTKLVSIQLFTTIIVLVVFLGIYLLSQYRQVAETSFYRMSTLAEVLGSNSIAAIVFFDNEAAAEVLKSLETQPEFINAAIFDTSGHLFADYEQAGTSEYYFNDARVDSQYTSDGYFILSREIRSEDNGIGWIALRVDPAVSKSKLLSVLWQSILIFLFGLLIAYLLSIKAQESISNSIKDLADITKKVRDSRDYSLRAQRISSDEIGLLVDGFNAMLEKISHHEKHLEDLVAERTVALEGAKAKAEESDHLKSAFLASMSHELRTPLNSIIGFTGILLQEMAGPLEPEQKKQLNMVKGSAAHLLELINDVLDISKIESGRLEVFGDAFKIDLLIVMAVSSLRPFAEKKGLELEYSVPDDLPELHSDKRRVEQVLLNLINNAIKFTEAGKIQIICTNMDDSLTIEVIDTGIGIKPDDLKYVFETFRQVDSGLNRVREGSGLGLAICKRLMELLGGSISVKSEFGKGSTFTVRLPYKLGPHNNEN